MRFTNKVVIVTRAAQGIGKGVAMIEHSLAIGMANGEQKHKDIE